MKRPLAAALILGLGLWSLPAAAPAPDQSLRPVPRGSTGAVRGGTSGPALPAARIRPRLRPPSPEVVSAASRPANLPFLASGNSPAPSMRPENIEQKVLFKRRKLRKGAVCGDIDIQGDKVGRVPGKLKGCGIKDAVRVRSVSGVVLSQQAVMTCETAKALKRWVERGVKPAFRLRGPVVELRVAAHYACRTRNSQRGARISEHGKGKAIDISAFTMMDGEVITVLKGWGQGTTRRPLRSVWKAACGPFGTVLGPEADRYHRDHIHLDTASYRSGPYCR